MRKIAMMVGMSCVVLTTVAWGQTTYVWSGLTGSNWTTLTNWTPTRVTPASNDILVFNTSVVVNLDFTSPETIGQLQVTNNSYVVFITSAIHTLNISGGSGADLLIDAGSTLVDSSNSAITIAVLTGATGSISGTFRLRGSTVATAHRLTSADASGITFQSGSVCYADTLFSGNAFGTTSLNSVIFANGSTYIYTAGSNPFGAAAPTSVVTFQAGSLYKHLSTASPSFSGRTYANFELNSAAYSVSHTGAGALTFDNITITDCIAINLNLTGGISIKGNISVASGKTLTFTPAGPNTVTFNGTSPQSITNSGTFALSANSNASVAINNANGLTLNTPVTLNSGVTFTSGNITLAPGVILTASNSSAVGPASSSSYIVADAAQGSKFVRQNVAVANRIFPIGTSTSYTPVTISNAGTADTFGVAVRTTFSNPPNSTAHVDLEWDITENTAGGSNATLTFQWNTADENAGFTRTNPLYIGRWNGSVWEQTLATYTDLGGGSYSGSASGFTSFSPFGVGNGGALPVQLNSFSASAIRLDAVLRWSTATETDNYGFEIERRAVSSQQSAVSWRKVGFVAGSGTSSSPKEYSYTDASLSPGRYAYRLKQIDRSGTFAYSAAAEVEIGLAVKEFKLESNYPNPFNPSTVIRFTLAVDDRATLKVFNILGQEVATLFDGEALAGRVNEVTFDASSLPSGLYFAQLESGRQQVIRKMALVK